MRILIYIILINFSILNAQTFSIARVNYGGGGDWYCDQSSIPNLLQYLESNTPISVENEKIHVSMSDENAHQYPYLYLTGHGNIKFTDNEIISLRSILMNSGFLHADDNYGMDEYIRPLLKELFPDQNLQEVPANHEIFRNQFEFPNGLPKIHEHDAQRPQALGIFENGRLLILYTVESDLGDGWESQEVHNDPEEIRLKALQMGANIIKYAFEN